MLLIDLRALPRPIQWTEHRRISEGPPIPGWTLLGCTVLWPFSEIAWSRQDDPASWASSSALRAPPP